AVNGPQAPSACASVVVALISDAAANAPAVHAASLICPTSLSDQIHSSSLRERPDCFAEVALAHCTTTRVIADMSCALLVDNTLIRVRCDQFVTTRVKMRGETFPCTEVVKNAYLQGNLLLFRATSR